MVCRQNESMTNSAVDRVCGQSIAKCFHVSSVAEHKFITCKILPIPTTVLFSSSMLSSWHKSQTELQRSKQKWGSLSYWFRSLNCVRTQFCVIFVFCNRWAGSRTAVSMAVAFYVPEQSKYFYKTSTRNERSKLKRRIHAVIDVIAERKSQLIEPSKITKVFISFFSFNCNNFSRSTPCIRMPFAQRFDFTNFHVNWK